MPVPMISSVQGLLKNMALEFKWEQRKKNPTMEKGNQDFFQAEIERINKQNEEHRKQMARIAIEGKLKCGQELSAAELEYIKNNAPDLYEKAVKIQKEREEYRRELKRCRTKEDVQELNTQKLVQFDAEVKAVKQSSMSAGDKQAAITFIGMRMAAIMDEHAKFTQSEDYRRLPTRAELDRDEKRKKHVAKREPVDEDFWRLKRSREPDLDFGKTRERDRIPEFASESAEGEGYYRFPIPEGISEDLVELINRINEYLKGEGTLSAPVTPDSGVYAPNGEKHMRGGRKVSVEA